MSKYLQNHAQTRTDTIWYIWKFRLDSYPKFEPRVKISVSIILWQYIARACRHTSRCSPDTFSPMGGRGVLLPKINIKAEKARQISTSFEVLYAKIDPKITSVHVKIFSKSRTNVHGHYGIFEKSGWIHLSKVWTPCEHFLFRSF